MNTIHQLGEQGFIYLKLDNSNKPHIYICNENSLLYFNGWDIAEALNTISAEILAQKLGENP